VARRYDCGAGRRIRRGSWHGAESNVRLGPRVLKLSSVRGGAATEVIGQRAAAGCAAAAERWAAAIGSTSVSLDDAAVRFGTAGRLTLNFHPDRVSRDGTTVAAGLLRTGKYQSQWITGLSAGSRSAVVGGERERLERELFHGAYDGADPSVVEFPVYGSFDLVFDPHGGSPRFGSSFVVLRRHALDRATFCVGDSHMGPRDVGTIADPWLVLAGLAEQAARTELLNRRLGVAELLEALEGSYRSREPSRDLDGYIEAQVHGGVSVDTDVEAVVLDPSFRHTSVERDLAAAAAQYGFCLAWHSGSELHVDDVPTDFRGPTMPTLAKEVARPDGIVDAQAIGRRVAVLPFEEPGQMGDPHESDLQQLKYLWHTLLAHGRDAPSA
jgi:hypothetical protein